MSLNVIGKSLVDFDSSHAFLSAVADAMEGRIMIILFKQDPGSYIIFPLNSARLGLVQVWWHPPLRRHGW